jgi:hypothetical protein
MQFRVGLLCLLLVLCLGLSHEVAAQNDVVGRWTQVPDLPFFPVHSHVLPTGKVMIWPGQFGISGNDPRIWDPATATVTPLTKPGYDIFCSGHAFLADGRLFVAGGHIQDNVGLPSASTYDPFTNLWTSVSDMNAGRWYPTATTLANGDVLVTSGSINGSQGENRLPEVFQVGSGAWRDLTNAQISLDLYPRMHLAPNGRVFNSAPSTVTRYLDTSGTGAWTVVANHSVNVYRDYAPSVMYDNGKVLVVGGGDPPTNTAEVIDLNASTPAWRQVASMAFARRQLNATLLPDGKVLVTGGTSGPGFNNKNTPVFAAEMWDPATETWATMASQQFPRLYHSGAVLLPDARVLTIGGDNVPQTEVYEPPYLFKGARPTINSAPATVSYGQTFFVETPNATSIAQVTWIQLSSVTHSFNTNQRINRLSFSQVAGGLNVVAPSNANLAPPGHYMLFILNSNGVPSVARIIRVTSTSSGPALSSLSPSSATVGGPAFTLTVNGSGFVSGSVVRWNGTARTTTFVNATQLRAAIPASDIAAGESAQVTVVNPAGGGTSNPLTFTINVNLSVSPTTIQVGGTVTATWSGIANPTATDWIGLYNPTFGNTTFIDWFYVSCSKTPGSARASGSCAFTVPTTLAPGTYELRLLANDGYVLLAPAVTFTVGTAAPGTLQFSAAAYSVAENGGNATITVTRTGGSAGAVGVSFATSNGTATAGSDYTARSLTVSFANGDTANKTVTIPILDDTLVEGNETVNLTLSNPTGGATLGSPATATLTIMDNDAPGTLQFSAATYSVAENGGNATITITRTGGSAGPVGVTVATSNGTATAGSDYTTVNQIVNFANGDTANKTVSIPILEDTLIEGNETVNLTLSSPTGGAMLGSPATAVLTITDNDAAGPTLTESPTTIPRGSTVTATWSGIAAPTARDWIGLYAPTAGNNSFIDWIYVSCSKTPGAAQASGSCSFVVPATVAAGTYELRLFANDGLTRLATSNSFTVTVPGAATLSESPTTISRGGTVTATWSGIAAPTARDWIGFFAPTAGNNSFIDWIYVSCSKTAGTARASGSCPFTVPTTVAPGTYQLRLLANDGVTLLATSNNFTVQ